MDLPPIKLIKKPAEWHLCLADLRQHRRLAIDLEANSLYAYRERICLIQISTIKQDYIIDPERDLDLSGLGEIIQNPDVEKIFHAAEYDLFLIKRQYNWKLENLFDTMWAARILGINRVGLGSLLGDRYGVKLNKRYQKANWCRRPLPTPQLVYAQMDTHFLPSLRNDLAAELEAAGALDEASEIFAEQTDVQPPDTDFHPDDFWSINGATDLTRRQQATLKALVIFRDQQARRQDRPPFKIFENRTARELAIVSPRRLEDLIQVHGMTRGQIRRYGRRVLKIIRAAENDPLPKRPRRKQQRPSDAVFARYERLHDWRKRRAKARGVESDVILSRQSLWDLAHANPSTLGGLNESGILGPWRAKTYGPDILQILGEDS